MGELYTLTDLLIKQQNESGIRIAITTLMTIIIRDPKGEGVHLRFLDRIIYFFKLIAETGLQELVPLRILGNNSGIHVGNCSADIDCLGLVHFQEGNILAGRIQIAD